MENVNNKNKRLTVIVASLLVVIGISFAYFVATTLINGNGSASSIKTAKINGATINVEGTLEFNDLEILPGHKNVSAIKVTATGANQLVSYNLMWNGTNSLNTPLNYTVYKATEPINPTASCERKTGVVSGKQVLSEVCNISNLNQLGNIIASGTINKSIETTKVTLIQDEMITATSDGAIVYYYVILEYPNLDESQDLDMGGAFQGEVTVEASSAQADISIVAIYQEQEDGSYNKVNAIPSSTSNYILNEERSTCTNNATPTWNEEEWSLEVNNLTKSGTDCNLYFKIKPNPADETLAKLGITNAKDTTPDFSQIATTDEGVYKVSDGMYGNYSYYWRGAVTNNYVKFAGFCWRIIRINGDGSIRLIYDGTTCHANGESGQSGTDSIAVASQKYNASYNRSEYVGYTYTSGSQRPSDNATGTASNLKTQTESWYKTNIADKGYDGKVATGKFCNDRNTGSGYTWESQPSSTFYYAGYDRSGAKSATSVTPTLDCSKENGKNDIYNLKAGAITMDEVIMAGGKWGTANSNYYLYNGQYYWTMSPYNWYYINSSQRWAYVFRVDSDGQLTNSNVGNTRGVRPVINLVSGTLFKEGTTGTQSNPYEVL